MIKSNTPPVNDNKKVQQALRDARKLRAMWSDAVERQSCSVIDVIDAATQEGGSPLRRLLLSELLTRQLGNRRQAQAILSEVRRMTKVGPEVANRKMSVGWVLDGRASSARFDAICDAMYRLNREPPSDTWPFVSDRSN